MKDLQVCALLDVYGEFLSEKQRLLTEYYYCDDLSLSEIAENEGITRQGASDIIKRSVLQLNAFEEKCGYCKNFTDLKQLAEQCRNGDATSVDGILEIIDSL